MHATDGSAWKGRLDLRFASARCLEIVCGTIPTPTSARIVERVTVGSTSASRTILRSSFLVVFLVAPDPVFRAWVPSHVHCSQQFLTAHSERSTWPATWHVDQPAVFIPMIRPLSNSLNCEKPLLARLPGMFRLPKSSYNRRSTILPRERAYFVVFGGKKNENESTKRNTAEVALCVPSIRVVWITLRRKSSSRKVDNIMRSRKCALAEGENRWKMTTSKLGNAFSYVFCMRGRCAAKRRSAVAATLAADCGSGDPASEAAGTRWPISMFVVLS
ncbi:uncharacterized protein TNCV_2390591 [Trichonephila clavipes]|nr:uncharacterized protein TNCV_2390591 [Trichonephila clavipes]